MCLAVGMPFQLGRVLSASCHPGCRKLEKLRYATYRAGRMMSDGKISPQPVKVIGIVIIVLQISRSTYT